MLKSRMDAIHDLPIFAAARAADPETSHQAAAKATEFRGEHHRRILEALQAGPAGKTEIGRRCGLTEQQVARRMHELHEAGLVALTGRKANGGREREWRVA